MLFMYPPGRQLFQESLGVFSFRHAGVTGTGTHLSSPNVIIVRGRIKHTRRAVFAPMRNFRLQITFVHEKSVEFRLGISRPVRLLHLLC